jgi:hypothetical protein
VTRNRFLFAHYVDRNDGLMSRTRTVVNGAGPG